MKRHIGVGALCIVASIATRSAWAQFEADPRSAGLGWRMTHLDLDVQIENEAPSMRLRGTCTLVLEMDESLGPTLGLNASRAAMQWDSIDAPDGASVELNERFEPFPGARLAHMRFPQPRTRGDTIELAFSCSWQSYGMQTGVREDFSIASWTDAWYPFALPRLDLGERLTARLGSVAGATTLRLPAGWIALSDGKLADRTRGADATVERWEMGDRPVARSFAAGPYRASEREVRGRTVRVYQFTDHAVGVERLSELIADALDAQEAVLGPFPFASYGVAEVPNDIPGWYAASQQTFIMAKSAAFGHAHGNLPLWSHEMCHGWWGNTVGNEGPGEKMAGEALAQLGVLIALEAMEGPDAMVEFLEHSRSGYNSRQCASGYFRMIGEGVDHPLSRLGESSLSNDQTHNLVNSKGMWVYHMLRRKIGDELFFATLRGLIAEFAGGTMELGDLREAFVRAAPDAELEEFFAQWLDRTGAPVLDVQWVDDGAQTELLITQRGTPFALDLVVDLHLQDGSTHRERIEVRESVTREVLSLKSPVESVTVDPERDVLIHRASYGPRPAGE